MIFLVLRNISQVSSCFIQVRLLSALCQVASSCRSALGVSADFSAAGLSARARLGSERVPEERRRPGAFHGWALALVTTAGD